MAAIAEDLDTCIGEVLKKLDELRIADNMLVIYMSDNGGRTEILNGSKGILGEGGIREPLFVRGPGIKGGTRSDTPVVSYDIMATVLDFVKPVFFGPRCRGRELETAFAQRWKRAGEAAHRLLRVASGRQSRASAAGDSQRRLQVVLLLGHGRRPAL